MPNKKSIASFDIRDTDRYIAERVLNLTDQKIYHYKNGLDKKASVTVYGTEAGDLQKNGGSRTYLSNLNTDTVQDEDAESDSLDYPWEALVFVVVASDTPTSGTFEIIEMEGER